MAWKPESIPEVLKTGTNEVELVEFWIYDVEPDGTVSRSIFGINVAKVREVIWLPEIIKIPNMPEVIEGVINLRGAVIPVIDLARWMKVTEPEDLKRKSVIITEFYRLRIGFIVHEPKRIRRISWEDIKQPPEVLAAKYGTKVTGVVEIDNGEFLLILDLENVLAELGLIDMEAEIEIATVSEVKGTIMIVDDSSVARKLMVDIFEKAGFEDIIVAKNGREALSKLIEIAKISEQSGRDILELISLVVTDVEMPQMDGYTLTRHIKEHNILKHVPVIVNTSLSDESNIVRAEEVKADGFLVKFDPDNLVKMARELIIKSRKARGLDVNLAMHTPREQLTVASQHEKNPSDSDEDDSDSSTDSDEVIENNVVQDDIEEKQDHIEEKNEVNTTEKNSSEEEMERDFDPNEIDKLIEEFKSQKAETNSEVEEAAEQTDAVEESSVQPEESVTEEETVSVDNASEDSGAVDIDSLIQEVKSEAAAEADVPEEEVSDDLIDQILSEIETKKADAGTYDVPTAEKLKEQENLEDIVKKLEAKLETIPVEDELQRAELISIINSLKSEIEKRKQTEEGRVIAKLYKVTRETEEETVKLMEKIESAMDIVNECIAIVGELEKNDKLSELEDKLNLLNDILFDSINQLQFQDITRQKIERVIVALKKLNDYLNEWFGTDFIGD